MALLHIKDNRTRLFITPLSSLGCHRRMSYISEEGLPEPSWLQSVWCVRVCVMGVWVYCCNTYPKAICSRVYTNLRDLSKQEANLHNGVPPCIRPYNILLVEPQHNGTHLSGRLGIANTVALSPSPFFLPFSFFFLLLFSSLCSFVLLHVVIAHRL